MTNQHQIPPEHIEALFRTRKPLGKTIGLVWNAIKYILSFTAIFIFFFIVINFPAYLARAQYYLDPPTIAATQPAHQLADQVDQIVEQSKQASIEKADLNDRLRIPKLNLDVPVMWDVPFEQIVPKLADGVVHYGGTALPGENGNVFITGHSSNFWWDKGKFNNVFANIDRLEDGDEIIVTYNNTVYRYAVEKKFVVDPSKIEVLNPGDHSIVSLMTCTPVGTTINRMIIQARQVSPLPGQGDQKQAPDLPSLLPVVR